MMKLILIVSMILFSFHRAEANEVKYLEKGHIAPYSGYLFTPEMEEFARRSLEENEVLRRIKEKHEELIVIYTERIEIEVETNKALTSELNKSKTSSMWEKVLYASLGIVIGFGVGSFYGR